ncbi:MAG: hypothetical protein K6T31_03810 [Alicyclobacillus sp.]|nr:hypothetical protein [Alicyclobacillus sp.]
MRASLSLLALWLGRPAKRHSGDRGTATLLAFGLSLVLALGVTTGLTLASVWAQVVADHSAHAQAYWIARGAALRLARAAQSGSLVAGQQLILCSTGSALATVQTLSSGWSVQVVAQSGDATDVVSFQYDTRRKAVTYWTDAATYGPP